MDSLKQRGRYSGMSIVVCLENRFKQSVATAILPHVSYSAKLLMIGLVVLCSGAQRLRAQSLRSEAVFTPTLLNMHSSQLKNQFGIQSMGYVLERYDVSGESWLHQLNEHRPGYTALTSQLVRAFQKKESLPSNRELHFLALSNGEQSFLIPEGNFVDDWARQTVPVPGQILHRIPLRLLVERFQYLDLAASRFIDVELGDNRLTIEVSNENAISASQVLWTVENAKAEAEWRRQVTHLIVERNDELLGPLVIGLSAASYADSKDPPTDFNYEDRFLNLPLLPTDRVVLTDNANMLGRIRSVTPLQTRPAQLPRDDKQEQAKPYPRECWLLHHRKFEAVRSKMGE